jgi:MoxR-like ATPase
MTQSNFEARLAQARESSTRLRDAIATVIVGQNAVVDQVLWALIAGGHVLLEGAPGLGKTLLVRTLAGLPRAASSRASSSPRI